MVAVGFMPDEVGQTEPSKMKRFSMLKPGAKPPILLLCLNVPHRRRPAATP